jgi:O-6-methylguanine DNA methyltransferase
VSIRAIWTLRPASGWQRRHARYPAARVDAGAASRAIGRANGSNRLAVIVPCHRVVAAGGGLGGYGGGLAAKRLLLDLEAQA